MAAAVHGSMPPFNPGCEDWRSYVERLDNYFKANKVDDADQKTAILLTVCGSKTYNLVRSLVSCNPNEKDYKDLVDIITQHFSPKPSSIMQRFKFNTRVRTQGESIAAYVAALRSLAEFCEFKETLNDMLRDRLVCGVNDERIQRRLLAEPTLTFDKALQLAQAIETADKDTKDLKVARESQPQPIHYHRPVVRKPNHPVTTNFICTRCGGGHKAPECPFKDSVCHHCKRKGHFARMCRAKQKGQGTPRPRSPQHSRGTHYIQEGVDTSEAVTSGVEDNSYSLFTLTSKSSRPYRIEIDIEGSVVALEIDTGASLSLMSERTYDELTQNRQIPLRPSSVVLKTYTGESLDVLGSVNVVVKHLSQELQLSMLVVKGNGPNLLGRDWLAQLKIDWGTVNRVQEEGALPRLLQKHSKVFDGSLGSLVGVDVKIHMKEGARPKFFKARSVPYVLRAKVEAELDRLQKAQIISAVQFSEWAAPIVPVVKQNGAIRVCGDYKLTVNQVAQTDKYPLPKVDDMFSALSGGNYFTTLDLSQAYLQLPIHEESKKYLTINTHKGLFEYNRLPFGVASAPGIFQRVMDSLLQGIGGVCVYLDDILVTGDTQDQHLFNLDKVLTKLSESGLKLNQSKCVFMAPQVQYLGYIIDKNGLHPTPEKVEAIQEAKQPSNLTELRAFLGIINYYSKFLPHLSSKLAPLYMLLRKDVKWQWGSEQQEAFSNAKSLLQSDAVLTHYDSERKLILDCDASPYGVGAVLSHELDDGSERPVGYASRTLTVAEKGYSQLDKESLAILFGVKKFHSYVYGRKFVIRSDHKPLYHLFHPSRAIPAMASARLQRWALTLSGYQYTIEYRPGSDIANADALSRLPRSVTTKSDCLPGELIQLVHYMQSTPVRATEIRKWIEQDPILAQVKRFVLSGWPTVEQDSELRPYLTRKDEMSLLDGCLLWGSRLVIPPPGRKLMLEVLHESHLGSSRMKSLARGYFWWPGMDGEIEQFVKFASFINLPLLQHQCIHGSHLKRHGQESTLILPDLS